MLRAGLQTSTTGSSGVAFAGEWKALRQEDA
jgi:hypothetical protein